MFFNFTEILSVTMVLFAVIDILGSIPIILSLREKVGHIQSEKASVVSILDYGCVSVCRKQYIKIARRRSE